VVSSKYEAPTSILNEIIRFNSDVIPSCLPEASFDITLFGAINGLIKLI
jgi:hypothetical protein